MIAKSGSFPFAYTKIASLVISLTLVSFPGHAETSEAPAVLQFARQYQQQNIPPQQAPASASKRKQGGKERNKAPASEKRNVAVNATSSVNAGQHQTLTLQGNIRQKEQEIARQSNTIKKLQGRLTELEQANGKTSSGPPSPTPRDVQLIGKAAESLRRTFTLNPGQNELADSLRRANQQAAEAKSAEAAVLEKQKLLNQQLERLKKEISDFKNDRSQSLSRNAQTLSAQLQDLRKANSQLKSDLAASQDKRAQTAEQVQRLESAIAKLQAEKNQYASDNKALLMKIAGHSDLNQQLTALQKELSSRQQKLTQLEEEKSRLQQKLSAAPTAAQLAESEQKAKSFKDKLEATTSQLQKKLAEAQTQQADLLAEQQRLQKIQSDLNSSQKNHAAATDRLKELQQKLDDAQAQQTVLLNEKQQLQQKLQNELGNSQKNSAAVTTQIMELQQKLSSTQTQLTDSQLKVTALQGQLDTALLLQKKERDAREQDKAGNATLAAAKKAAEEEILMLQQKLGDEQQQQTALLAERQQLQQKLQDELNNNQKNSTVVSAQLKALQQKLSDEQQQQTALLAEKQQLQQKLQDELDNNKKNSVAVAAQLKEFQQKLSDEQKQQTALLSEKQQLQQKFQNELSNNQNVSAAASAQLKELQQKLTDAQRQQTALLAEKQQLQQKIQADASDSQKNSATIVTQVTELQQKLSSTQTQLADSQLKVTALQGQLDTALLLQKKERDAREQEKAGSARLAAGKKTAEDEIQILRQKLTDAQTQKTALLAEKQQLQQTLQTDASNSQKNNVAVTAQLKDTQQKLADVQVQQAALLAEKQQLQKKFQNDLSNSEKNSAAVTAQLKDMQQKLADAQTRQTALQQKLTDAQSQQTTLLAEKQQLQKKLQGDLSDSQKDSATATAQLKALQQKYASTQTLLADSQLRVTALQGQLDTALLLRKKESDAREQEKAGSITLAAGKKAAEDEIRTLKQKLSDAQMQQTALLAEKQQLQNKLQTDASNSEKNSTTVTAQLKDMQQKLADAQTRQAALQQKLTDAQAQQTALLAEKQQLQQQFQANASDSQKTSAAVTAQLKTLQQKYAATQTLLADSQLRVTALQGQLDTALLLRKKESDAREQDKAGSATLAAERKAAEDEIRTLRQKLTDAQTQQTALLAEKQLLQQKLQTGVSDGQKNSTVVAAQLKELQQELVDSRARQTALLAEKQQLQQKFQAEASDSQKNSVAITAELKALQQKYTSTQMQLTDSQLKVTALQGQLDTALLLRKKESDAREQDKAGSATLAAERKAAEDEIRTLRQKLTDAQTQQTALLAEKQQIQTDASNSQKNGTAVTAQLKELQQKLADADTRQAALQQKLTDAQTQQTALLTEKQQLQQKLQNDASDSQKNSVAVTVQVTELQQKLSSTQTQLTDSQLKITALQSQLDTALLLQKKGSSATEDENARKDAVAAGNTAAEEQIKALQEKLDAAQLELVAMKDQGGAPAPKGIAQINADKLKKKSTREAYAIGVSLGAEILQLQAENRNWASAGSEKSSVLAGIVDIFQGNEKLSQDELRTTLMNVSKQVKTGRDKFMTDLDSSTKKFMDKFTKQKNAQKSNSGVWYRISYTGDTPIPDDATLDVVVKESLANGTVIEDMDAKGIVLTQPISAFPPVFSEALKKLKNHGSITIVVPPALAYGDKGYPPKVPPNATMIYDLRISDVYPGKTN